MAITVNLNTLRQSSGRHWRIGQGKACRTICLFYRNTCQEQAVRHMASKLVAARQLEGKLSLSGMARLAEVNSGEMELFQQIMESMS